MSLETLTATLKERFAAGGFRKCAVFDLGTDGVIRIDGTQSPTVIDNTPTEADVTIQLSLETLEKMAAGKTDPTMAYMMGKLKVRGDMGVAMKLNSMLEG